MVYELMHVQVIELEIKFDMTRTIPKSLNFPASLVYLGSSITLNWPSGFSSMLSPASSAPKTMPEAFT